MSAKIVSLVSKNITAETNMTQIGLDLNAMEKRLHAAQTVILRSLAEPVRDSLRAFYWSGAYLEHPKLTVSWQIFLEKHFYEDLFNFSMNDEAWRKSYLMHGGRSSCPLCGDTGRSNFHGFTKIGLKKHLGITGGHEHVRLCDVIKALSPPTLANGGVINESQNLTPEQFAWLMVIGGSERDRRP
jgi:hypothetical protein